MCCYIQVCCGQWGALLIPVQVAVLVLNDIVMRDMFQD
jgi:hypothetical protein